MGLATRSTLITGIRVLAVLGTVGALAVGCAGQGPTTAIGPAAAPQTTTDDAMEPGPSASVVAVTPSGSPTGQTSPAASRVAAVQAKGKGAGTAEGKAKGRATATGTTSRSGSAASSGGTGATTRPRGSRVIGTGTPASCTSAAVVAAVAAGGVVGFDCGPKPVTIRMTQTAKVVNRNASLVLDGGGRVTLSGGGVRRVLYQNTCDAAQGWATDHCDDQQTPVLEVRGLTFADGNATGQSADGGGGGAIFVRGGQLRVIDSTFVGNRCDATGPDVGGAAIRVLDQYHDLPVTVSGSTFTSGSCSNGGALSSIGVSWKITNSVFRRNVVTGKGANPARAGTPGGGSGGAIYLDGNRFTLDLRSTVIEDNTAPEGGGAIFFVSNNRTGTATITGSTLRRNVSKGFETPGLPGIFFLGAKPPTISGGVLQ